MANTVKLKRSAVAGKVPSTGDLALGELALNTFDGKAYIKKSANGTDEVIEIGSASTPMVLTTKRVIDENVVVASGENILSINDVTVANGFSVEVPTGSTWIVVG
ncbi:MAG: hypothetical protein CMH53_04225 [Myxococcales bacterium]|nr:hypothetical protein [Myxococcales bacterium]|tara:strand:- start:280 stop:594 length:315 start_codon:yes stop_codon:yes gene_type:complete